MAEKKEEKGKLELLLFVASKWDVLRLECAGADKRNAKKVGEMNIYGYMKEGAEGVVFYKEVFDEENKLRRVYLSGKEALEYGDETIKLKSALGIKDGFFYIDNKREIENG